MIELSRSVVVLACGALAVGCGATKGDRAAKSPPAVGARAQDSAPDPATALTFSIASREAPERTLIAGTTTVGGHANPKFETHDNATNEHVKLELRSFARADGTLDIDIQYEESGRGRGSIRWAPVLHIARGASAVAQLRGDGYGRELRIQSN